MASIELEVRTDDPREATALRAYWTLAEDGETWTQTVTAIRNEFGLTQREMQALVQEAGTAYVHDVRCPDCGDPLEATSRTNFAELLRQGNTLCSTCKAVAEQTRQEEARQRREKRQEALREAFPVYTDIAVDAEDLTLFQAVALHALFSDPAVQEAGLTTPTNIWPKERRWAPASLHYEYERRLLHATPRTLIRAHRDSAPTAFVWEDDQPTDSFYLGQVSYYLIGAENDLTARAPRLLSDLNQVFREGPWPSPWLNQWRDLWEELAVAQAGAYLDMKLREHHLEMKQGDGTRTTLADALATFSLGQVFNFIYRAAKDSAAYYQRGGINKMQAANSTIGRISASADRARANGWDVKPFGMPWNLPLSAIAETFFSKVMWQADMMQFSLFDARPPLHAWAAEEPEEQTPQDEVIDLPAPKATLDHMEQYGEDNSTQEPMRYALVTPDGNISFATGTYQEIRTLIGNDGAGETGMEFLDGLYPVAAYFYVPFTADQRRMNKAANGMYWELSAPAPGEGGEDADPQEHDPEDRIIKLRGPVAFLDRHNWGLSAEQESALRDAHKATVMRLRARGWL
ncbi:hypothetical protein ABTX34_34450 [Streptomyces sp. NPDC096538]|uniref:hypothetical protein n=1 Tax=Streptomyces sp. NPDC096538 TaxID=3155427 RepID=UPI003332AA54